MSTTTTVMLSWLPRESAIFVSTDATVDSASLTVFDACSSLSNLEMAILHASSLVMTSHSPSDAKSNSWSSWLRISRVISGSAMTYGLSLWSPIARLMASSPITRFHQMKPPAFSTRTASSLRLALWSELSVSAPLRRATTARESPALATHRWRRPSSDTTAVVPMSVAPCFCSSSLSVARNACVNAIWISSGSGSGSCSGPCTSLGLEPGSVASAAPDAPAAGSEGWCSRMTSCDDRIALSCRLRSSACRPTMRCSCSCRCLLQCSATLAPPWPSYTANRCSA
mmetsp:Transcript_508/g.1359  ORF Transcript_508/g.1359 Transcript_508/m.1359 type:complete len:284 (-) Transcript_508:732-1583(-)